MADAGRRPQMRRTEVGVEVGLARLVRQAADEDLARALRRVLARGLPTIAGIKHQRVALHAGEVSPAQAHAAIESTGEALRGAHVRCKHSAVKQVEKTLLRIAPDTCLAFRCA